MLWNAKPSTFHDLRRSQNYILVNNHTQWYNIPISAPLPSVSTITIPTCFQFRRIRFGRTGGDLPLGDKPAIESYLCDEVTLMALPMSPILKESFFPPDDSQNPPPDHVADHANVSIFG